MNKNDQYWFPEIDYLKALAIVGVLIIHTTDDTASVKQLTGMTFSLLYIEELVRFAVPMFIFVSGFVLYNKYKSELPMKEFYTKRFTVIFIPYIIFSLLYNILNYYLGALPTITVNSVIASIFSFNASGHFWYIQLILTLYIFYPAIVAYYGIIKNYFRIYTFAILFLSILIMYLLGSFIPSFGFALDTPFKYLIYFVLGIFVNDNYEQIHRTIEKLPLKIIIILSFLIISLPFFSMFLAVDPRCGTHYLTSMPYYYQFALLNSHLLHICIFILCFYLLFLYNPKIKLLKKIGEYSYGMFLVHVVFHNFLLLSVFPKFSILPTSLTFYILLFTVMLSASYFTVKLMLINPFTAFIITGKLIPHSILAHKQEIKNL